VEIEVTVTDEGQLLLTVDRMIYPPIPIEAVQPLAAAVPSAQAAAGAAALIQVIRELTRMLVVTPGLTSTITFTNNEAAVTVDPATFAAIEQQWNLTPDQTGALVMGPVTITEAI
jgi:hypothetical protein